MFAAKDFSSFKKQEQLSEVFVAWILGMESKIGRACKAKQFKILGDCIPSSFKIAGYLAF